MVERKLNIGIIAHSYLPVSGGIQTYIHANAKEFVKNGHNVHVIVPNNSMNKPSYSVIDGVRVHRTSIENIDWSYPVEDNRIGGWQTFDDHQRWGAQVVQMAMESLPIIREEKIDLIHTHFTATFVGELLWQFHKIPYVDSIYGLFTDYKPSEQIRFAARNFYRNGSMKAVIVVGNHVKRQCRLGDIPDHLLRVVNPSIDFNRFNPAKPMDDIIDKFNLPVSDETKVIFCPIRLQERKGFKCALQAFALARQVYPDSHLIISGGSSANPAGIEKPLATYHKMTNELDIVDNSSLLLNKISDLDMVSFYRLADVVLMPSLQEGFGISVLEALAMKKPIAATNIPPFRESSSDYALFFEPDDAKGAAQAIVKIWQGGDFIQKQIDRGFRHVRENYNASRLAEQMVAIYLEVLHEQSNSIDYIEAFSRQN